jgi:hypothetical protein
MLARALRHPKETLKEQLAVIGSFLGAASTPRDPYFAIAELVRRATGDTVIPVDPSLSPFELRAFSQNGEDGVIAEIVRRSGAPGRFFVEFGAGAGCENNCAALAEIFGWSGLYIEADPSLYRRLEERFRGYTAIRTLRAVVTPSTIEHLLSVASVPRELDLLSIDVNGLDLWIWESINDWSPRVVIIEYNSSLGPTRSLVQPRDHTTWERTSYFGASIAALKLLARKKGYRLVHTELTGNNAFFVRSDLPGTYLDENQVAIRSPNHFLAGRRHLDDPMRRAYIEYDPGRTPQGP